LPSIIGMTGASGPGVGDGALIVADQLGKQLGIKIAIELMGSYTDQILSLKNGKNQLWYAGTTTVRDPWLGQADPYNKAEWGPQLVRAMAIGKPRFNGIWTTKKTGIKTFADLKGKRLPFYPASAIRNYTTESILLAHGVTWDDVKKVNFDSAAAAEDALLNGLVDAVMAGFPTTKMVEAQATVGAYVIPFSDSAETAKKWAERQIHPLIIAPKGAFAGVEQDTLIFGTQDHFVTLAAMSEDSAYQLAKGFYLAVPSIILVKGGEDTNQKEVASLKASVPFHPGAITFFKEVGLWTAAHEAWQQDMLKKEQGYIADWKAKLTTTTK